MRYFLRITSALLCALMLAGCASAKKYPWALTKADSVYENTSEDISTEIYQNNLAATGGYFLFKNQGGSAAFFDSSFYLLVKKGGAWYRMDTDTAVLTQHETKVDAHGGRHMFFFDWESVYGKLPNGTYRLIGSYQFENEDIPRPVYYTFKISPFTPKEDHFAIYGFPPAIYVNDRLYGPGGRGIKELDTEELTQIGVIERNVEFYNMPNENFHANNWEVGTPIYQWGDLIVIFDGETYWPYEAATT